MVALVLLLRLLLLLLCQPCCAKAGRHAASRRVLLGGGYWRSGRHEHGVQAWTWPWLGVQRVRLPLCKLRLSARCARCLRLLQEPLPLLLHIAAAAAAGLPLTALWRCWPRLRGGVPLPLPCLLLQRLQQAQRLLLLQVVGILPVRLRFDALPPVDRRHCRGRRGAVSLLGRQHMVGSKQLACCNDRLLHLLHLLAAACERACWLLRLQGALRLLLLLRLLRLV